MSRFTIRRPGVYVEEITIQPKPIEGASTSTAAFLGQTQTGPNTPTLITSTPEFQLLFGGYFGVEKYLPYAIEGFFANGGQKCYVSCFSNGDYASALAKLEVVEDVSILYSPNAQAVVGLADAMIVHCERLKNRFTIFDSLKGETPTNITKPPASSYAALYYPWISVKQAWMAQACLVPPGGHIAGIYARGDRDLGVHRSPANQQVKGAVGLEYAVSKRQQDTLNPQGINCIRTFEGRGILVWGAKTLSSDPEYKYVSVRRFLVYLEQSIKKGTAWVTFEPNNEATWGKVKLLIDNFLTQTWKNGMLMGVKEEEAYFVRCDRTTMTQNDIDNGRLNVLIGLAMIKPAEFMILRINHTVARP